jgi:hypothetical protein
MLRKFAFLSAGAVVAAALAATPAMAAGQTNAGPTSLPLTGPVSTPYGPYAQAQAFMVKVAQSSLAGNLHLWSKKSPASAV